MFKCNCPFEVRAGCSEPKCPHYVKKIPPPGGQSMEEAFADNFGLTVEDLDEED